MFLRLKQKKERTVETFIFGRGLFLLKRDIHGRSWDSKKMCLSFFEVYLSGKCKQAEE